MKDSGAAARRMALASSTHSSHRTPDRASSGTEASVCPTWVSRGVGTGLEKEASPSGTVPCSAISAAIAEKRGRS